MKKLLKLLSLYQTARYGLGAARHHKPWKGKKWKGRKHQAYYGQGPYGGPGAYGPGPGPGYGGYGHGPYHQPYPRPRGLQGMLVEALVHRLFRR